MKAKKKKAVGVQTGTKLVFHVEGSADPAAGIDAFSEEVEINFKYSKFSNDPDSEGVEFFEGVLKEYFDGAKVFLHRDDGSCPVCDEPDYPLHLDNWIR